MNIIKLTPENARQYIGKEIVFKTRNNHIVKRILGVSTTAKTIYIDHPDLRNKLQIVTRDVSVIL